MSTNIVRQIVLDTETTGMNKFGIHYAGHRVIEIGAVEIINRRLTNREFHVYLKPDRKIDIEAFQIHGISDQFLKNQPTFSEIVDDFIVFIRDSELIMHNASFDLGFLNQELCMFNKNLKKIESYCTVIDSLKLARKKFPGQRNNLDALCERCFINNFKKRNLHSALVDAQLLARVFLSMTGGQTEIEFNNMIDANVSDDKLDNTIRSDNMKNIKKESLKIIVANEQEKLAHSKYLDHMQQKYKYCIWKK